MSHLNPGLISAYNSLTDRHLAGYFSNSRIRRHLQRAGLITRSGRIVPDKEYRHKLIQRAHQRHVRECLAQAIFHKVLEMERVHQIEIKRKLEEFARRERVHKMKVERSKRYEEDIHILSPRPPTGARGMRKQHSGPEGEHSESSESPGSSRPNTAPGKMQRPVRLKPIHSNSTTASLRRSSPYRLLESSNENDQPFNCTMDKESRRRRPTMEVSRGISPYCLPVINNFVTPVPPATKRKERGVKVTPSGMLRGRRLRPTTASSGADINEDLPMLRSSVHQSRVCVNMMYFGKTVHLSHDLMDMRDEVKVFQQHCGGENLCVFKGKLCEGDTFQFISRRHRGFPFSLTFFLNGLQVERLSSCCEFKHRKGSRLGGRHGHFGFCSVEGASPCYKCIIAMGLDKKPTPPPKRVKDDGRREESVTSTKDAPEMETERTGDDAASHSETSQPQDMETQVKEETVAEEDKVRDDYEEDFEADDEGPAEDVEAKEKKPSSPSGETVTQVKERDDSETEDDERDDDIKSRSDSSSSDGDQEENNAEAAKDSGEDEKTKQPEEVDQEETAVPPDENKDDPNPEESAEAEPAAAKDSDLQDSAGDSTEIDVSDTSVPSGKENKESDDTSGDKEVEKTVDESKQEEEQERAKSVQEKLAEAILKESHCSSEPELSDTSTEEEEESADKGPEQDSKDEVAVKSVTFTEDQQMKCEEGVAGEAEAVQDHEETSEPKEQEDETEQEPNENSDAKDEKVKIAEEDEKAASEEDKNTAENGKSEDMDDANAPLQPVSVEDDKTSELQEDAAAKSADGEAAEKDEENADKTTAEADEMGQGAKSSEQDESSVSVLDKKPVETAATDNEEAEAMTVSETVEMKTEDFTSEERKALDREEAPITNTEERQQGDREDRDATSETEVTAANASSSLEDSGDTTVEKTEDISEDKARDESSKDDIKEEEVSTVETKDDDLGEEQTEKSSLEIDDKVEEKCEEKERQATEITEGENREENKNEDQDKTEEENNETGERTDNFSAWTKNTEGKANEEQAKKIHSEEKDKVANEEKADESEKTERDEDCECVQNKNDKEEAEEKGATTDKTESEKINTADDEAEKEEMEDKDEKVANNKDDKEFEEKKVAADEVADQEEISEIADKSEKSVDADLDKDKIESIVESEDIADSEAANVAHGTTNDVMEAEDVKKETEGGNDSEKGEIDAENGELSPEAKHESHEDEAEAQTEGKYDMKTLEDAEDGRKTEEPTEGKTTEVKEVTVESEDGAEKHENDKVDGSDVVQSESKEEDDCVEKQDESIKNDSEPETSGTKIDEEYKSDDRKDDETKQDENGNISDPHDENRDSGLMRNVQSDITDVIVASSAYQAQSAPTAVDSDDTAHKLDESMAPSDTKADKHPHIHENAAAAADLSEEASKASEEGASVVLKPQAQSLLLTQNNNTGENIAVGEETPEALAREDNTDLVTNWVTMHQTSKYFETFVEPLEDLKQSTSDDSNEGAARSTELPRSSSLKMANASENAEIEPEDESKDKSKDEAVVSDLESSHSEDEPCEKDALRVEEAEVKDFQKTESEQNDKESEVRSEEHKGSKDKVQEGLMQATSEQTDISKTEVESIAGTHHSVASGRLESVKPEEKTTDNHPGLNEKQTSVEDVEDVLLSSKTEEHHERSTSPEGLSKLKETEETREKSDEQNREVTEITDFTTSKSDNGSQEEARHKDTQPNPSDASINGDKRDMQLIRDIKHTVSKDRLSSFSVDETLFGPSSYPLLTAARTESGH